MKRWLRSLLPASLGSLCCLSACGAPGKAADHRDVTPQAARALIARGEVAVIDVRTPEEYAEGCLEGATLVPVGSEGFVKKVQAAAGGKPVLVYCRSGHRSSKAAGQLAAAGEKEVCNLAGGILAWRSAGNKVVK
jgi:rhodanese-related sulfurtransferase